MGAGACTIKFNNQLPSFSQIQNLFYEHTGLKLSLVADLQLQRLSDSTDEIVYQLEKDVEAVIEIERLREEYLHRQDYEWLAEHRDLINKQLSQLSHIQNVRFKIYGFYEIDFGIEGNEIELYFSSQKYGLRNLIKVLIDLGGKCYNDDQMKDNTYPGRWRTYKKWQAYNW
jgi:hypothetical protein